MSGRYQIILFIFNFYLVAPKISSCRACHYRLLRRFDCYGVAFFNVYEPCSNFADVRFPRNYTTDSFTTF